MADRTHLETRLALGRDLQRASQQWKQLLVRGLKRYGYGDLRPSFAPVLLPLCTEDGLPIGELGRRTGLSKQAMTEVVRLMEKRQLVRSERDAQDNRLVRVYLAPRGKAFPIVANEVLAEIDATLQARLPAGELRSLQESLGALAERGAT
jgi:DNA-binding MarR family transcriptional regulator